FMIHDDYLAILIEAGPPALVLYLSILIVLINRSRQCKQSARDRFTRDLCGATFVLIVSVMVMGIPGAFYTEVLSNLYIYGAIGLMLSHTSEASLLQQSELVQHVSPAVA